MYPLKRKNSYFQKRTRKSFISPRQYISQKNFMARYGARLAEHSSYVSDFIFQTLNK